MRRETIAIHAGIEQVSDIIEDLDRALDGACPQQRPEAAE
jgi:O-acetylhomoserine (thiol)-lyase